MPLSSCPVCGGGEFLAAVSAAHLHREIEKRNRLVASWVGNAVPAELKDLTDFMHDGPASLVRCEICGIVRRQEARERSTGSYEEDANDPGLMGQLLPRYAEAFRHKRSAYKERLRRGASVLEIGSHLGGFLQVAEEWDWRPVGLDVGKDTSEFARQQGFRVRRETTEDSRLSANSVDAVFVWNCFEQLAEPGEMLIASRRLLQRDGLLILRVPNVDYYLGGDQQGLAWNNLLGFPYLYGYTADSMSRLVSQYGFEPVTGYNSELITMPIADQRTTVRNRHLAASARVAEMSSRTSRRQGILTGPWIEIVYRKSDRPARPQPRISTLFLERAA